MRNNKYDIVICGIVVLWCAVLVFIGLRAVPAFMSSSFRIYVCADIEGDWRKVTTFVDKCNGFLTIENDDPDNFQITLQNNTKIVFLGDIIDKGVDNIQVLKFVLYLKEHYPDRVILILGNRDIKILRFLWELEEAALNLQGDTRYAIDRFRCKRWEHTFAQWIKKGFNKIDGKIVAYTHGNKSACDKILKFKWMLSHTMGAAAFFENFKKEIGAATDQETYDSFMNIMMGDNGLLIRYLRLAQIMYLDSDTHALFVHGGISQESVGYVPESSWQAGDGYTVDVINTHISVWVEKLNRWARDRIHDGLCKNAVGALPLVGLKNNKVDSSLELELEVGFKDGKQVWIKYQSISVVHGRPWGLDYNIAPLDDYTARCLERSGVRVLAFGHSPVGEIPIIIKNSACIAVACDITIAGKARNAAVEITSDGVTVYADYEGTLLTYSSQNFLVGTSCCIEGRLYWYIAPLDTNALLVGHWTRSSRGSWSEPTYAVRFLGERERVPA